MKKIILLFTFTLLPLFLWADSHVSLKLIETYKLKSFPEPSGLTYSGLRDTLFMVGDEGHVAEISLSGEIINEAWLGDRDLEGVSIRNDVLYVLDERMNQILLLDSGTLEILNISALPQEAEGPYEGLSIDPEGALVLVNQMSKKERNSATVLRIAPDGVITTMPTHIKDQSSVTYHSTGLYIISDTEDRLYHFNEKGEKLWDCKLPGENQEGIAIDSGGFFYIAQDSGGILKLKLTEETHE